MSTITFDFRHNYHRGERRSSNQDAYQWDLGHVAEIYVPESATYEIHYFFDGFTETDDYAVESISTALDGGYKLIAHVPNTFFERNGILNVYLVGSADNHVITSYEGYINIRERLKPEDYADDDPDNGAQTILSQAHEYARQSEAWSKGTRDGEAVPSTADQYHNNSKYWSDQAEDQAEESEAWAAGTKGGTAVTSSADQYHNNSKYYKEQAAGSATAAATSEENAEAWAVGTKDGTAVTSDDPQYHNNAKYWAEQAAVDLAAVLGDIAIVETSTASQAFKVGEFLIMNKLLYKVTAAIAQGGTITPGTNCVQTNVGAEMANRRLWFKNVAVTAQSTAGTLIDVQDSRITSDYILEGNNIYWGNSSNITSEPEWSTDTAGHFIVTGTCSAATTATFALVKADSMTVNNVS